MMASARIKAFLWHLGCSVLIGCVAVFWVFVVWYPSPLHEALEVAHVFLLVLLVDIVIGPFLTLLVYKQGKRTLVFDMGVIVILQFSALAYGLWSVAEGRPAWVVFNVDRFDLVQVVDIDQRSIEDAREDYREAPWLGPGWVGAAKPDNAQRRNELLFESVMGGADIAQRPELYRPLSELSSQMRARARELAELGDYNGSDVIKKALSDWPAADGWLPLMARAKPMVVLLNKERGQVLGVINLNPW